MSKAIDTHPENAAMRVGDILHLMRPTQWSKNGVVFAALLFSKHLFILSDVLLVFATFVAFSLVASGCYVMNDMRDCDRDREHPTKRKRPLPSGRVPMGTARFLSGGLMVAGLAVASQLGFGCFVLIAGYLVLQFFYTYWLKEVVILDVMAIAAGFVVRAGAGGVVIDVLVSPWLIICTFLLMTFLGFSKRRHEITLLEGKATEHRASLAEYSPYFLDQMISVVTASTVVAYAIYTVSPEVQERLGTQLLYLTIPFVLYGIFRYLYLVHQREEGGNPTQVLLSDRPLIVNLALWVLTSAVLLYV